MIFQLLKTGSHRVIEKRKKPGTKELNQQHGFGINNVDKQV